MGLSSTTTVIEGFQFCIFDLRRGQREGQELDKILFFFPSECPYTAQLSVIGLCEGIITFTRIFSPEAACEVIEAEKHSHVFYQAEPDIWMVMVVEKNKDTESVWRCDALREVLKEVHSLFMMFHGSLRSLLDKQPSGELARSHLYSFVLDYLTEFHVGKKIQMPTFRECLRERVTVQMLTVSREVAIDVQSLVTVLGSSVGSTFCHSLIFFQDLLVSTTLSPASQKIINVEDKLSRGWGGENAYHVSGYRYLLIDGDWNISRASPPGKVTTLTKDSLLALNRLREEVDLEKARAKRDNPDHENDLEVCIRAKNNAWVIAKVTRGRELYMVLEKASETLLYASDALEKFSDRYCDGVFSLV